MRAGRAGRVALALALSLAPVVTHAAEPKPFRGRRPVLAIRMDAETTNAATTLDMFRLNFDNHAPRFAAREISLLSGRPVKTRWVDSASCPALIPRLRSITTLQMRFTSPVPPFVGREVAVDGTYVSVRAAGETVAGGPEGELTISGNLGAWVDWAETTDRELEPCWSGTEPAGSTGG